MTDEGRPPLGGRPSLLCNKEMESLVHARIARFVRQLVLASLGGLCGLVFGGSVSLASPGGSAQGPSWVSTGFVLPPSYTPTISASSAYQYGLLPFGSYYGHSSAAIPDNPKSLISFANGTSLDVPSVALVGGAGTLTAASGGGASIPAGASAAAGAGGFCAGSLLGVPACGAAAAIGVTALVGGAVGYSVADWATPENCTLFIWGCYDSDPAVGLEVRLDGNELSWEWTDNTYWHDYGTEWKDPGNFYVSGFPKTLGQTCVLPAGQTNSCVQILDRAGDWSGIPYGSTGLLWAAEGLVASQFWNVKPTAVPIRSTSTFTCWTGQPGSPVVKNDVINFAGAAKFDPGVKPAGCVPHTQTLKVSLEMDSGAEYVLSERTISWPKPVPEACIDSLCLIEKTTDGSQCRWGGVALTASDCAKTQQWESEPKLDLNLGSTYDLNTEGSVPEIDPQTQTSGNGTATEPSTDTGFPDPPGGCLGCPGGVNETGEEGGACFPNGFGWFNPFDWVLKPTKCAFRWLFIPTETGEQQIADNIGSAMSRQPFQTLSTGFTAVSGSSLEADRWANAGPACSSVMGNQICPRDWDSWTAPDWIMGLLLVAGFFTLMKTAVSCLR